MAVLDLGAEDAATLSLATGPLRLRRAWPRSPDHLLLEYVSDCGDIVPAQWMRDQGALAAVCEETRAGARRPDRVRLVCSGANHAALLLQCGGEDRVLRGLAPLLDNASMHLIVHRPERRAVVRCQADAVTFAKFLPIRRLDELLRRDQFLRGSPALIGFNVPEIIEVVRETAMARFAAARGESLHDCRPASDTGTLFAVGRALRGLHDLPFEHGSLPSHGAVEEIAVLSRWMAHLRAFDPERADRLVSEFERMATELRQDSRNRTLVHRDFYDKQVFVDGHTVTFIDLDTLAIGEPALDVGNMVAHLEHMGASCSLKEAFREGYGAGANMVARIETYREATHLRLRCVHAFRPPFGEF